MTVAEAWSFLTPRAILRRDTGFFPAAPYIDACEHTPEGSPDRARFIEAMWALVRDGDDTEQAIGTTFLSKFNIPDAILKEAVDLYVSRNLDMHSPLATIVNRKLPPDAFARLRAAYLSDPPRHARFASVMVIGDPTLWPTLAAIVRTSNDPDALAQAVTAAWTMDRDGELGPLLKQKPEAVLREAGVKFGSPAHFLKLCGLNS